MEVVVPRVTPAGPYDAVVGLPHDAGKPRLEQRTGTPPFGAVLDDSLPDHLVSAGAGGRRSPRYFLSSWDVTK